MGPPTRSTVLVTKPAKAVEETAGKALKKVAGEGEQSLFARVVRVLIGRGGAGVGLRVGFAPLDALADVSPEVAAAFARLQLAKHVEHVWPGGLNALLRSRVARTRLEKALTDLTDAELTEALRRLRDVAGETVATKSRKALLDEARKELVDRFGVGAARTAASAVAPKLAKAVAKKAAKAAGKGAAEAGSTAFDLVEKASKVPEIGIAQRDFERALGHGEIDDIRSAANSLADVIALKARAAGLNSGQVRRMRGAIATVVRSFERQAVDSASKNARRAVVAAMDALADTDPAVPFLRRVLPWMTEETWPDVTTALSRIPPVPPAVRKAGGAALKDALRWRIGAVKGVLGDVIARAGKFRRIRATELARARRFLESPAGEGYSLLVSRTPIRATVKGTTKFALSYDDAVLLVNQKAKKVIVVMAAQFKAGDAGALKALAQTERDALREAGGRLLLDGEQYAVELGVLPTRRVFVGTKLGVDPDATRTFAQQLGRRELDFIDLPTDPDDLDMVAAFMLQAIDAIPKP